jgi:thioredoxin-related protein
MDQQDNHDQATAAKRRKDKGKLIFLAIVAVAVVLVYGFQRSGAELPNWPGDLSAGLVQAKQEERKVLVFFADSPPSTTARKMSTTTLKMNKKHIKRRKLITVLLQVKKSDELAKRYSIRKFPTFLLLDAQGKELNRRVGSVGAVPFRNEFLDGTKVLVFFASSPPSTTARKMSTSTLKKSNKHIKRRKLITVLLQVKKTDELAKRYSIKKLPTFLLLDSQGKELNRRVGLVGEVPFRNEFLDCTKVVGP